MTERANPAQSGRQSEAKCPACGDVQKFDGEWCRECGHVEGPTLLIPVSDAVQLSNQWRREWEANDRPAHSCIQEAVPLLEGATLCGVCGASLTAFVDGDDG